jgi:hypothetical protein
MPKVVAVMVAVLFALCGLLVAGRDVEPAAAPDRPVYYADAHWGTDLPPSFGPPLPGIAPPPQH